MCQDTVNFSLTLADAPSVLKSCARRYAVNFLGRLASSAIFLIVLTGSSQKR